jgi:hypothetical protein
MGLCFDRKISTLTAIDNKLTPEIYSIHSDACDINAVKFHILFAELKLLLLDRRDDVVTARYEGKGMTVEATPAGRSLTIIHADQK